MSRLEEIVAAMLQDAEYQLVIHKLDKIRALLERARERNNELDVRRFEIAERVEARRLDTLGRAITKRLTGGNN